MSEISHVATGRVRSPLLYTLLLLVPLISFSGCGSGQTSSGQTNSVPVNLAVSFPQNSASVASNSTIGARVWAVVQRWIPSVSSAWAVGTVTDIASLTVSVSAPDLLAPITKTVSLSTPTSGQVVTLTLDIPVGSNRVFTVSCLDATRVKIFKGNSSPVTLAGGQATTVDIAVTEASVAGSLTTARYFHTATLLQNGKVLVVGGIGPNVGNVLASAELFDPVTNQWTPIPSLTNARYDHTATLLQNGKVLVVGGDGNGLLASAELFDPVTETWISTGSLATARCAHMASLLHNGKVLVVGGEGQFCGDGNTLASAELFDPETNQWVPAASLTTARQFPTATLLQNGKILVVGGFNNVGVSLASAELFDPVTEAWTATASLNAGRYFHTATLLQNGQVLVVGGDAGTISGPLASAELFNPATNQWALLPSGLTDAREDHTATLLQNGMVLVVGGAGVNAFLTSAELFNPATNGWTKLATGLTDARILHTDMLLPNRQVLVVGGGQQQGGQLLRPLLSAELYDFSLL